MKSTILVSLIFGFQVGPFGSKAVDEDSEIYSLLAESQAEIAAPYKNIALVEFRPWIHVDGPAVEQLFPQLEFASVTWSMRPLPNPKKGVAYAARLKKTVAVDPQKKKVVADLPASGNYEEFGKLLADHRITIQNAEDAKLIYKAFCELHHKSWTKDPFRKLNEGEWRLGIQTSDQTVASDGTSRTVVTNTYYTKVTVDPKSARVLSWKLEVETSDRRKVQKAN